MKKLLSVLLAALLLATAIPLSTVSVGAATTGTYGYLTYEIVDGEVTITDCDESALLIITIPDKIEGYSVTAIGYGAFRNCVNLEFVLLPEDVSVIGDYAFYGCSALASIDLRYVRFIGDSAFYGCTSLSYVYGKIYGSIGKYAFFGCSALASIDLRYISSIGEGAFWGCSALTQVTLRRITTLPSYAFYNCMSLTEVNIGENITTIRSLAFAGCSSLTYISIPAQVTSISFDAFFRCSSLTDVYYGGISGEMPSNLKYMDGNITYHYSTLRGKCGANSYWTFHTDISKLVISGTGSVSGDWGYLTPRYVIIEEGITGVGSTEFAYTYGDVYVLSLPSTLTDIGSESFMCGACTVILNGTKGLLYGGTDMCADGYLFFHNTTVLNSDYPVKTSNYYYTDTITLNGKMYYVSTDDDYSKHHHNYQNFSMDGFTGIECYNCKMPRDYSDLSYKLENGEITINECLYNRSIENGYPTEVTIPDTILGYPVTRIGKEAFYNCKPLTSVTIPDSVTTIGDSAFASCSSLTSVTIPDSVTSIGDYAFSGCSSLMNIEVDADNAFYSSLDGVLFNKKQTTLIRYPAAKEGNYTIPNSVSSIGNRAFYGCGSLTSVTIPDSVTTIGEYAFYDCDSLISVTIGDSVPGIGERAFSSCSSLTSVTIGDSVTSIGEYAFSYCTSLTSVTIPDSVTTIGDDAFYHCTSLQSVTIGDSVTSIGDDAFYYCTSLQSVTIGDSVTSIGDYAFRYCESLTDIYYTGSRADKANIAIGYYGNTYLTNATWHYNACKHKYDNACDVDCNLCYELREVTHSVKHVAAVAATCSAMGNIEYWYCDVCGYAWLDAECTLNTNLKAVILPALEHVYDNAHDADCNVCGETRAIVEIAHGDANGDGAVNARDLVLLQQFMAGWDVTFSFVAADVDGDGSVNARDAAVLQQYVAGWDVTLGT